jgi:hypothetical protein
VQMVDSKEKLLKLPEIVLISAQDIGTDGVPLPSALASVAKEGTLKIKIKCLDEFLMLT